MLRPVARRLQLLAAPLMAAALLLVVPAAHAIAPPAAPACVVTGSTFTHGTAVPIPTGPAVLTSTIEVSGAPTSLTDVDVQTFLQHTFAADLDITLASPAGTVVTLTTDNGAGNDNVFNGTVWDDDANPGGQVPYTTNTGVVTDTAYVNLTTASPLAPEEPLAAFVGEDPNGTWTLTISDDLAGDGGSLDSWSLSVTAAATAATATAVPTVTQSTPTAIPTGPAVVTSTVNVTGAPTTLTDVNLTTTILTHTFAADLDITLTSPAGTVVTLSTDNGAGNDNVFNGTLWDDDANPGGQVPYTTNDGLVTDTAYANLTTATPLTPEEPLGAFIGEDPNGTWTITISDDLAGDGGSLDQWSLDLTATEGCPPPAATLSATTPASPSAQTTPLVAGSAPSADAVDLYLSTDCTGPVVATGTAATLGGAGIPVPVASDTTNSISAVAKNAGGSAPCSNALQYVQVDPPTVTLTGTTPASPAASTTPSVKGTAPTAVTVALYRSADCSGAVAASGTAAELAGAGIALTVPSNASTSISAKGTNAGGTSACSNALTYVQAAPVVVPPVTDPAVSGQGITPLLLTDVAATSRCVPSSGDAGPRIGFTLSAAAKVAFILQRKTTLGYTAPRLCPKVGAPNLTPSAYDQLSVSEVAAASGPGFATVQPSGSVAKRAARAVKRPLARTTSGRRGHQVVNLLKTLRQTTGLTPGRYRVLVQATRADGVRSTTETAWFWVLRPAARR